MVTPPGSGYGSILSRISGAIASYFSTRWKNQKPWGIKKTIDAIKSRFFDLSPTDITTAVTAGEKGFEAGKKLGRIKRDSIVDRNDIPRDRTLPVGTAYRARVLIKSKDDATGGESYGTITMDFKRNPTWNEINKRFAELVDIQTAYTYKEGSKISGVSALDEAAEIDAILGITRRT